jgi:hypothetical protein
VKIEKNIKFLPQNETRCPMFADYILKIYDSPESKYSPQLWTAPPDAESK